jgi:AraC-like DNA-binding protein
MTDGALLDHVSALLDREGPRKARSRTPRAVCISCGSAAPTGQDATVYRPLLCLVLQGAKEVATSRKTLRVADGQSLVVSHALPVVSRITEATPDRPYVALVFPIDLELLRGWPPTWRRPRLPCQNLQDPFSISLCPTDPEMEEALLRYLRQCETDETRRLLAPITAREIHARLLLGPHAETAAQASVARNHGQPHLSGHARDPVGPRPPAPVGELADRAGMSSSAFFEHFKAVTGTSPLQYQKDLRLLRAREALRSTNEKVSEIAFGVGYESSAQFSREYARKFGVPPRQDRLSHAAE